MRIYQGLSSLEEAWSLIRNDPGISIHVIGIALFLAVVLTPAGVAGFKFCLWCNKRIASTNIRALIYLCSLVVGVMVPGTLLRLILDELNLAEYLAIGQTICLPTFVLATGFLVGRHVER